MPDREKMNLPDLLGAITGGERLNLDVVQCALAVRPARTPAGRAFEAILLLQNASDVDVDVTASVRLPDRDAARKRNRFFAQKERLLVGLRPAEVGFLTLPVSSSPKTKPAPGYKLAIDLAVKRVGKKKAGRVRAADGGGVFVETELPEDRQEHIWHLQQMVFSAARAGRSGVAATFEVLPPSPGGVADLTPEWVSLWTMRDHVDDSLLAERVRDQLNAVLPHLHRETVFFPLLDVVQTHFRRAGFWLKAGEAVYITKLLTLVLEQGAPEVEGEAVQPDWFRRTCRVLADRPAVAKSVPLLVQEFLFFDLVRDAVRLGLTMIGTVTGEDFGDESEQEDYVNSVLARLQDGGMDFQHAYLPLVLGGLIANMRVVMPEEDPRESIALLQKARHYRADREMDEYSEPVFDLTDRLIARAQEQVGG